MKKIKEIIIVEGKSDKQFLQSFLDADIFTCNGSAIDGFDIEFIKNLAKKRGAIILTDPDYPGLRIRNILNEKLENVKHAYINKKNAIKKNKVGVAETTKKEVLNALANLISYENQFVGNLKMIDLYNLHLVGNNSCRNRKKIIDYFHLGHANAKTLLNHLNLLNIDYETLWRVINDK